MHQSRRHVDVAIVAASARATHDHRPVHSVELRLHHGLPGGARRRTTDVERVLLPEVEKSPLSRNWATTAAWDNVATANFEHLSRGASEDRLRRARVRPSVAAFFSQPGLCGLDFVADTHPDARTPSGDGRIEEPCQCRARATKDCRTGTRAVGVRLRGNSRALRGCLELLAAGDVRTSGRRKNEGAGESRSGAA